MEHSELPFHPHQRIAPDGQHAMAAYWTETDTEARKRGEQTGLDTLVVHAVNDEY